MGIPYKSKIDAPEIFNRVKIYTPEIYNRAKNATPKIFNRTKTYITQFKINKYRLCLSTAAIPISWLIFAVIWYIINKCYHDCVILPNNTFIDALMFSIVTQSTIGYGYRKLNYMDDLTCVPFTSILLLFHITINTICNCIYSYEFILWINSTFTHDKVNKFAVNLLLCILIFPVTSILYTILWYILERSVESCIRPENATFLTLLLYSIVTQSTIGYGDIYLDTHSNKCIPHIILLVLQVYTGMIYNVIVSYIIYKELVDVVLVNEDDIQLDERPILNRTTSDYSTYNIKMQQSTDGNNGLLTIQASHDHNNNIKIQQTSDGYYNLSTIQQASDGYNNLSTIQQTSDVYYSLSTIKTPDDHTNNIQIQRIKDVNNDLIMTLTPGVHNDDNQIQLNKDVNNDTIKDVNNDIIKDDNNYIIKDVDNDIIKDDNNDIIKDDNNDIIKDVDNDIIKDDINDVITTLASDVHNDDTQIQQIKDVNNDLIEDVNNDIIKYINNDLIITLTPDVHNDDTQMQQIAELTTFY